MDKFLKRLHKWFYPIATSTHPKQNHRWNEQLRDEVHQQLNAELKSSSPIKVTGPQPETEVVASELEAV